MSEQPTITDLLKEKGIESSEILGPFDHELLLAYLRFLEENDIKGGFFSKQDGESILERHLFDSLVFVKKVIELIPVSRETRVVDVGTGPGLPGFLFACLKNRPHLTLMDSSKRRLHFLEEFVDQILQMKGIKFQYERSEESSKKFPVIVARALIPYPGVLEILLPIMEDRADIFLFQSRFREEASKRENQYLKEMGLALHQVVQLPELAFLGERKIIHLKKIGPAARGYPRSWKRIKEEIKLWEK